VILGRAARRGLNTLSSSILGGGREERAPIVAGPVHIGPASTFEEEVRGG
jgi:hypothetical protein